MLLNGLMSVANLCLYHMKLIDLDSSISLHILWLVENNNNFFTVLHWQYSFAICKKKYPIIPTVFIFLNFLKDLFYRFYVCLQIHAMWNEQSLYSWFCGKNHVQTTNVCADYDLVALIHVWIDFLYDAVENLSLKYTKESVDEYLICVNAMISMLKIAQQHCVTPTMFLSNVKNDIKR